MTSHLKDVAIDVNIVNVKITNAMARIVGLIAKQHPDWSIDIRWHEGTAENLWQVTATDGVHERIYCVDDENGEWMPMSPEEARSMARGGFMHQ
jgi:hypothetical protein